MHTAKVDGNYSAIDDDDASILQRERRDHVVSGRAVLGDVDELERGLTIGSRHARGEPLGVIWFGMAGEHVLEWLHRLGCSGSNLVVEILSVVVTCPLPVRERQHDCHERDGEHMERDHAR